MLLIHLRWFHVSDLGLNLLGGFCSSGCSQTPSNETGKRLVKVEIHVSLNWWKVSRIRKFMHKCISCSIAALPCCCEVRAKDRTNRGHRRSCLNKILFRIKLKYKYFEIFKPVEWLLLTPLYL